MSGGTSMGAVRMSVALKAQYSWGEQGDHGMGLITSLGPKVLFVHASSSPPPGVEIRLRFALQGKFSAVELRGKAVIPDSEKIRGFGVEILGFIQGEGALFDFLGLPRPVASSSGMPAAEAPSAGPVARQDLLVRLGINKPDQPGFVMDLGEGGIHLKTTPNPEDGGWQAKQSVRIELDVPMGQGRKTLSTYGRIVRVGAPEEGAEPVWELAIQFRDDQRLGGELLKRALQFLPPKDEKAAKAPPAWEVVEEGGPFAGMLRLGRRGAAISSTPLGLVFLFLLLVLWVVAVWWLTRWRLEALLGPMPDPASLPKPP